MSGNCEVSHITATNSVFPEFTSNSSTIYSNASQTLLLPPVRTKGRNSYQLFSSQELMAAVNEDPISLWLKQGEVEKLEQAVLDGYGDHLNGKTSRIPQVNRFLKQVPNFQAKIEEIHRAVTLGKLRSVQHLIDRKKLAFCRDQMGATPLHKAVVYAQKDIINYLLERYGTTIHARDHRGRTVLHYSAVLSDGGEIYKLLLEFGADPQATDMFGKKPEDYLQSQGEISAQVLREGAIVSRKSRKQSRIIDPSSLKFYSSRSLMHRSNIKDLIKQGNLSTLEEVVLQGFGDRLLGETSTAPLVQDFIDKLPDYIDQITELHRAAMKGNLREFQGLLDRKSLITARDQVGATPLHKAVLYGHIDLADYIATNFPVTLDARDNDGRTALHYASALEDDRNFYNMLVKAGASPLLPDFKGKNADFYLRFPDQINLQQIMKRSQRLNANYAINTANRIKSKSPSRRKERSLSPSHRIKRPSDLNGMEGQSEEGLSDKADTSSNDGSNVSSNPGPNYRKLQSPIIPRIEVSSANLKRWIQENNLEMLEGVVLEGHGDRLKEKVEYFTNEESAGSINYISETVPKIMNKIRVIHAAVSCGDLIGLQDNLEKKDYVLSKDHLGMAPLHKATIMGHIDVVQYILEKFPETVNAKDKEGRTALHYAAATTNRNGNKIYRMLIRAGADPRIRDSNGKTSEYYRVHLLSLPNELSRINKKKKLNPLSFTDTQTVRKRPIVLPNIQEKITASLNDGDTKQLQELVLEGFGDQLLGRTSWGEEARKFLKGLPHLMDNIKSLHASIINGDINNVERILTDDPLLIKAKDENGLFPIHIATAHNQPEIVNYMVVNFPATIHFKDNSGRNPLHISAQNKSIDIYRKLVDSGGDPKTMDQKGKTADHYLRAQTIQNYDFVSPVNGSESRKITDENSNIDNRLKSNVKEKSKSKIKPVSKPVKTTSKSVVNDNSIAQNGEVIESETIKSSDNQSLKKVSVPVRLPSLFDESESTENESLVQLENKDNHSNEEIESSVELTTITDNTEDFVNETENVSVSNENSINNSINNRDETKLNIINDENSDKTVVGKNNSLENKESEPKVPLNTESIINNIDESVNEQNNEMPNESMTESEITLKDKDFGAENAVNELSKHLNEDSGEKNQINAQVVKLRSLEINDREIRDTTITNDNQNTDAIPSNSPIKSIENDTKLEVNSETNTKILNYIDLDSQAQQLIEPNSIETKSNNLVQHKEKQESVETNVESKPRKQSMTGSNKVQTKRLSKSLSQQQLIEQDSGTKAQQRNSLKSSPEFNSEPKNQSKTSSNSSSRQSTQSGKSVKQSRKSIESAKSLQKQSSKSSFKSGKLGVKENSFGKNDIPPNVISEKVINDSSDTIKNSEDSELWSEVIKEETDNPNETQIEAKEIDSSVRNKRIESVPNNENVVNNEMTAEVIAQQTVKEKERQSTANDGETENVAVFEDKDIENKTKDKDIENKTQDIASEATADYEIEVNPNQSETLINSDQNSDQVINDDLQVGDDQNNEVCNGVEESNKEIKKLDKRESYDSMYNVVGITKTTNDSVNDDQNKNEMNSRQTPIRSTTAPEERTMSRSDSNTTPYADDRLNELIDHWLEEGDLLRLEHVVIAGQGERLIGRTSVNRQVQDFLELVPTYMAKIRTVHETVIRGNLNEVKHVLTRKRFALSRDHFGASPLHLAVLHGHLDVMLYIITQFPETIDGPDNEGRTPLHYAAVMSDDQKHFYHILENAKADPNLKDKSGRSAKYYIEHPGELTVGQLLENYRPPSENRTENSDNVEVWQRPPTADIESQLTPTSEDSDTPMTSPNKSNQQEVDAEVHVDAEQKHPNLIKGKTFDRSISSSSFKSKTDEQLAEDEDFETISNEFKKSLKEEKVRLQKSFDSQMSSAEATSMYGSVIESVQEARPPMGSAIINGENYSGYDLTEIKDENGRTVLHFAALKPQKRTVFYKMLSQAEYLIPERDAKYRTIRDIAVQNGIKDNLQVIDQYILDAFTKENVEFVRTLAVEGYDNLLNVVDSEGHDVIATLKKNKVTTMTDTIQDLAQFQKNRDELHTFIRHGYAEGVAHLTQSQKDLVVAKSERGRCALHIAVLFANLEIIGSLINANPKAVNTPDNLGRTPLHYAMASSLVEEIGRILIRSGANRALRDVRMRTPSYYFVYKQEIRDIKREEQNLTI